MCVICVEIMRQRITIKEGIDQLVEGWTRDMEQHKQDIINANAEGDVVKLKKLIDEGYKKERWL